VVVLDTDVLTLIQHGHGEEYSRLVARLSELPSQPVCVTIVSFEEQMRGWLAWIAKAKAPERQIVAYRRLRMLLEDFQTRPVLDFDDPAVAEHRQLSKKKIRIGAMDLKIAAIALANDAVLVSRNLSDFRKIPGLQVEDWTTVKRT
jgi:tRNA(fMet)-specific endonuclease VapC